MGGLKCDGLKTSYVNVPVDVNASFSVTMWIYPDSQGSIFALEYGLNRLDQVFTMHFSGTKFDVAFFLNPLAHLVQYLYSIDRTWTHVAVSVGCSSGMYTAKLYFNGLEVVSLVQPVTTTFPISQFVRIGSIRDNVVGFSGGVSQFGLFNYEISTQQVYSIFKGTPSSCKCPVGFYCNSTTSPPTACPSGTLPAFV
jgi:hypothetical protein